MSLHRLAMQHFLFFPLFPRLDCVSSPLKLPWVDDTAMFFSTSLFSYQIARNQSPCYRRPRTLSPPPQSTFKKGSVLFLIFPHFSSLFTPSALPRILEPVVSFSVSIWKPGLRFLASKSLFLCPDKPSLNSRVPLEVLKVPSRGALVDSLYLL